MIRNRQRNWIGHILRGDSLMKIAFDNKNRRQENGRYRPRMMLLAWMFDKTNKWKYQNVKELAKIEMLADVVVPDVLDGRTRKKEYKI